MMKGLIKLGITLAAFAAAACVGLAFVNQATEKQIKINADIQLAESLRELFPTADSFDAIITSELEWNNVDIKLGEARVVKAAAESVGIAVMASGPSYGGPATILVGIDIDGKVAGVKILDLKDTPGLGANAASVNYFVDKAKQTTFPDQFKGRAIDDGLKVKQDGGEIDTITASTITSRAITKIIKACGDAATARFIAGGK